MCAANRGDREHVVDVAVGDDDRGGFQPLFAQDTVQAGHHLVSRVYHHAPLARTRGRDIAIGAGQSGGEPCDEHVQSWFLATRRWWTMCAINADASRRRPGQQYSPTVRANYSGWHPANQIGSAPTDRASDPREEDPTLRPAPIRRQRGVREPRPGWPGTRLTAAASSASSRSRHTLPSPFVPGTPPPPSPHS